MQSRYYDPNLGRFLNADAFASTGQGLLGNNMFAYCNCNPANFQDAQGTRMDYIRFDSGAPVAFPSPGTLSQTTPQPTDTEENVSTRLKRDIQSIIEYPYIQKPLGALSIYDGCKMISDGFLLILTPVPSLQDELIGIAKIFWGFKDVIDGIDDLF